MDKDATVRLSYAGNMIMLLQKGLLGGGKVQKVDREVQELEREVSFIIPVFRPTSAVWPVSQCGQIARAHSSCIADFSRIGGLLS